MIIIFRTIAVLLFAILICLLGWVYCLFSPRNPKHVRTFGRMFGRLSCLFGLKVETRILPDIKKLGNCIYIANHQNNFDMVTASYAVQERTVTVGKKNLIWIPFFGPLYWLTGNILIDRNNRTKALDTISQVVGQIKERQISVWMFPEGTRSRGRGLMPFKTGAFHAAISAGVPIVPICVSETTGRIKLNRWRNGHVIVEMLPPIDSTGYNKEQVRDFAVACHQLMAKKIADLNAEVDARNAGAQPSTAH